MQSALRGQEPGNASCRDKSGQRSAGVPEEQRFKNLSNATEINKTQDLLLKKSKFRFSLLHNMSF